MNETLQQSVAAIIDRGLTSLDTAISFLSSEVPDLIRQLLLWHMSRAGVIALIAGAVMYLFYRFCKYLHKENAFDDAAPLVLLGGIIVIVASVFFIGCIMEILQIAIAPKLYLIEYAAKLYKGR